jgi:hypothetical protein
MGFRTLEWVLRDRIRSGLETVRGDLSYLDLMFPDLSTNSRTQLKDWLLSTEISILLSFPRHVDNYPAIVIQMAGETPVAQPIGEMMASFRDGAGVHEEFGDFVRKAYQVFVITESPDVTVVLSGILQHILKSMRRNLANQGFYEMTTAQTDALDLKVDVLPVYSYMRVTTLSVLVEDSYVFLDGQASQVVLGSDTTYVNDGIEIVFPTP